MNKVILKVHVTPRGSKNEVIGFRGDILCVKITAPPVDGAANSALIKFLADYLGIRKNQIALISGEKSREKSFEIIGMTMEDIKNR